MEKKNIDKKEIPNEKEEMKILLDRIEAANKQTAELLERQEKLRVFEVVGGETEAGLPEPKVDENASVREMLKGTGYDDMLFPVK